MWLIRTGLEWNFEPWAVVSLVLGACWYGIGLVRLRRRYDGWRVVTPSQIAAFVGGMAVLVVALLSPLDTLSDDLFSVHMVQHLLLLLLAPPLLVYSRPAIVFLWAFPLRGRKKIGFAWSSLGLSRGVGLLMHPLLVWMLSTGIFIFWHLPGPYDWALKHEVIHVLEHLTFFLSALMFWTIVIEPSGRRRIGYGATLVFVGSTAILSGLPGALMILAPRPLYAAQNSVAWGLTQLQDQQLAGVIMWVPAGLAYVVAIAWLFIKWMDDAERHVLKSAARVTAPLTIAACISIVLSGCNETAVNAQSTRFGGDPHRGATLIRQYGCGSCHTIPGINGADGLVGPPLTRMGARIFVAGLLRNTPDNMARWLMNPQQVVPGNAMPDMGLSEKQARDVAAYLATLR